MYSEVRICQPPPDPLPSSLICVKKGKSFDPKGIRPDACGASPMCSASSLPGGAVEVDGEGAVSFASGITWRHEADRTHENASRRAAVRDLVVMPGP